MPSFCQSFRYFFGLLYNHTLDEFKLNCRPPTVYRTRRSRSNWKSIFCCENSRNNILLCYVSEEKSRITHSQIRANIIPVSTWDINRGVRSSKMLVPFPVISILEVLSITRLSASKARIPPRPSFCSSHVRTHLLRKDTLSNEGSLWAIKHVRWSFSRFIVMGLSKTTRHCDL